LKKPVRFENLHYGRRPQAGALFHVWISAWYTNWAQMSRRILVATILLLGFGANSFAVESTYFPLTIVRSEVKTRDRVVYWEVNTPIYHEDPYFEVAVRVSGALIVAERDPERHEMLPMDWKPGVRIQGRVDKRHLYLQRPNGSEVRFIITHRTKAPQERESKTNVE
jgi:hypothetical protein